MKLLWQVSLREDDGAGVLEGYGDTAPGALANLYEQLDAKSAEAQEFAGRITAWSARVRGELEAITDGAR